MLAKIFLVNIDMEYKLIGGLVSSFYGRNLANSQFNALKFSSQF